ncbi:MAG: tetratricopeptide repeat protein [Candidatus Aminicenantes bacterium]|nr:tetratricopeptide repeat protein [Candidatus Aminicenantes bacterium]NIM79833.1 tetratricopeptide repeat protein [Candidatus Aminicenantes bacterium]NIN19163.1 tetratricopeptide repeat protein [Candidatus Aminicenantes bacterium]NIN43067.1 tetratricopeptide repeat protein [Candidatus Aminicenantes bacterium]NIN85808.1 tetratricopeptide repeat protein [Candidatus Aminicenantes bacterium]
MNRPRKLGKRRRRLYWTFGFLAVAIIVGITIGILLHRSSRPSTYRPGEKIEGITSKLSLNIPEEAPTPRFSDVTSQAGIDFRHFIGPRSSQLPEDMGSGAAWGDYDNDGDEDLFLVSSGGALTLSPEQRAPCVLYENKGDGTFRRNNDFPGLRIIGMGAAWGDYDSDGWLDLVVTGYNSLILYRNHGGTFTEDPNFSAPPGFWAGASWGDFDNDRDLDLYVCGYVRYKEARGELPKVSRQYGREVPYTLNPSSYEPEKNLLFRNNGDGTFREVAFDLGVDNPKGRSLSALWHDFNDDGWLDLYIANDISDNVLYLNKNGKFKDISHAAWVADYRGAMGLAAGDWNGDGDDDLFVTHWIAQENALYDSLFTEAARRKTGPAAAKEAFSPLRFMDAADMVGLGQVALHRIGWGTEFADLDADGWLDLLVANGSTFETEDVSPRLRPQRPFLFWNRQGKTFHNLAPLNAALNQPHVGRGLAVSDYDCDGHLDFVIVNHGEGVQLFRGVVPPAQKGVGSGNWVILKLRSRSGSNKELNGRGEGARLIAYVKGRRLRRCVGGASYLSQSSRRVHFGLGPAQRIDSLEVRWPGGGQDIYTNLQANKYWELTEGEPAPRPLTLSSDTTADAKMDERQRVTAFWQNQRAAVHAMKVEKDIHKAIHLFKKALTYDPNHEDSLYYLVQALVTKGDLQEGIETLEKLTRINPSSHRGYKQVGFLRARNAETSADLLAAEKSLDRALAINPEETGVLLLLGEIDLIQGELEKADQRFAWVCRSNPRSVAGFYLRGYIAWKSGDRASARSFLSRAIQAKKQEKKPKGSTSEGDVRLKMHTEVTLFPLFFKNLDDKTGNLDKTFKALDEHLKKMPPAAALFEKSGSKTFY